MTFDIEFLSNIIQPPLNYNNIASTCQGYFPSLFWDEILLIQSYFPVSISL